LEKSSGASIETKGKYYPHAAAAAEGKEPPLYLHVSAASESAIKSAVSMIVNQLKNIVNINTPPVSVPASSNVPKYPLIQINGVNSAFYLVSVLNFIRGPYTRIN
jgi:hypothetical protein